MIGWYIHHQGRRHLHRATAVAHAAAARGTQITGISSLPEPADWPSAAGWVQLARDDSPMDDSPMPESTGQPRGGTPRGIQGVSELQARRVSDAPQRVVTYRGSSVWDDLARCESGGNWAINTGNGYYGGLQFSYATWHAYGGGEFAEYPHHATREEQIAVAERLHAVRGFQPWPSCRVKLGLP